MRSWLILILLSFILPLQSFAGNARPIDIIFDIDWTSFYTVEEPHRDSQTVFVEGKLYRPTDFFVETVEWLLKEHPEVRISFFSGGEKSRNETLLSIVHLSDGRSLKDISFRIFSKENLYVASTDSTLKFAQRYKKDVSQLLPDWNPERSILIDDQVMFAKAPLRAVDSLGVFNFQKSFDASKTQMAHFPPDEKAWNLERKKAALWSAMLASAFAFSSSGKISFSQAAQITWQNESRSEKTLLKGLDIVRPFSLRSCEKIFAF